MSRTIFLARLLGLYCLLTALFLFTHKPAAVDIVTAMVHSQAQLFFVGLIGISVGLAMVLATMSGREACCRWSSRFPAG